MARVLAFTLCLASLSAVALAQTNAQPYYFLYGPKPKPAPVKKVVKKIVKKVVPRLPPRPAPLAVRCTTAPAALPQRVVNCKVFNKLTVPVCAHLTCTPAPAGDCANNGGSSGGQMSQPDCSWNVRPGCSSPTPLFPGGAWSFGYITSDPRPVNVIAPAWGLAISSAINGTACPL